MKETKENPSAFLFNDPDVGGKLRTSKDGLASMGVGNGSMWMVKQQPSPKLSKKIDVVYKGYI